MLTRDQLINECRARSGSFTGLLTIYGALVGVMALTASLII